LGRARKLAVHLKEIEANTPFHEPEGGGDGMGDLLRQLETPGSGWRF